MRFRLDLFRDLPAYARLQHHHIQSLLDGLPLQHSLCD